MLHRDRLLRWTCQRRNTYIRCVQTVDEQDASNVIVPIVFQLTNFRLVDYRAPEPSSCSSKRRRFAADGDDGVRCVAGTKVFVRDGASDG